MAVYRRNYKPYAGALTPEWSRCLVLFRYSRRNLFRSKFLTGLFVVCFFWPLVCLLMIYLAHNATFLEQVGVAKGVLSINNTFFFNFMRVQGVFAFLLTAFTGPGLISPDLANGALPLYFCRPFSRAEYVLGKASVLAILLSQITWVPGVVLFVIQAGLAGWSWTWSHLWIAGSLILSSLIWIAILSLLAMALSAWVKWRIVAGALLLGVMFFGAGFAGSDQRRATNRVGPLLQYCSADGHRVERAISAQQRVFDSGRRSVGSASSLLRGLSWAPAAQGACV